MYSLNPYSHIRTRCVGHFEVFNDTYLLVEAGLSQSVGVDDVDDPHDSVLQSLRFFSLLYQSCGDRSALDWMAYL